RAHPHLPGLAPCDTRRAGGLEPEHGDSLHPDASRRMVDRGGRRMNTATESPRLYRPDDMAQMAKDLPVIERVASWCKEFLARPQPELGRGGSVCPFVPRALNLNRISFVVVHTENRSEEEIDGVIAKFRDVFLHMEPVSGPEAMEKSILVILPDV